MGLLLLKETAMHAAIDLAAKLATFTEAWQPRTVSLFNGHDVMVARLRGEYHWHVHPATDDFFLVLAGALESTWKTAPRCPSRRDNCMSCPKACATGRAACPRRTSC
jgi:hypothetical protein